MPNLEQVFHIAGNMNDTQKTGIQQVLKELNGVNHMEVNIPEKMITVRYMPGVTNIQRIKEAIESRGVDVSDGGDD